MLKGTILLKQGRFDQALSYFQKCLRYYPFEKKALLHIGIAYNLMARYERAGWFFKVHYNRYPNDRSSLVWLVETNLKSGDTPAMNRYIDELLLSLRIADLNSIFKKNNQTNFMDLRSRELVLKQILHRATGRLENAGRQSL
jgi:tetratricopeptide (TPR) repeat protein